MGFNWAFKGLKEKKGRGNLETAVTVWLGLQLRIGEVQPSVLSWRVKRFYFL